jgi:hypothetical protein
MNAKFQPKKPFVKPTLDKPMSEEKTTPVETTIVETPTVETPAETPVVETPVVEVATVQESPVVETVVEEKPALTSLEQTMEVVATVDLSKFDKKSKAPIVAPEVKNLTVAPVVNSAEPNLEAVFEQMRQTGTVYEKMTMASLDAYKNNMTPGLPVSPDAGARQQYNLWKLLEALVEASPEAEFKKLWSVTLAFIHGNINGVFNDRYVYRFADQWVWGLGELNAFQRLLNLATTTANSATRKNDLRRVSIDKTLAEGFSEKAKQRLGNYYQS